LTRILVAGAVGLGIIFTWFFGNFFYDLLWAALEDHHVQHSDVIAYVLGHFSPFIVGCLAATIIYLVARQNVIKSSGSEKNKLRNLHYDMTISDAIEYIVNDSRAVLKQPAPPQIMEFGPAKGRRAVEAGVEHSDARALMNTKLISGELQIRGRRQIDTHIPNQFEQSFREIPRTYWDSAQLHMLSCFSPMERLPQTMAIPGKTHEADYTQLMVNSQQVSSLWPRKPIFIRLRERVMRKPRLTYWRLGQSVEDRH